MLAIAIPAGDSVDDSVLILLGAPAAASAIITALLATMRTDNRRLLSIAAWALASAVAAVVLFGVLFWAAWSVDCATREGSCS